MRIPSANRIMKSVGSRKLRAPTGRARMTCSRFITAPRPTAMLQAVPDPGRIDELPVGHDTKMLLLNFGELNASVLYQEWSPGSWLKACLMKILS